jgi:uncharacterized membrane protein (UPF0127 family)
MVTRKHVKAFLAAIIVGTLALAGSLSLFHQSQQMKGAEQHDHNNLAAMSRCRLEVGKQPLDLWIARTDGERELGLMWVQPGEMADNQGMLFIFPVDQAGGFWMKNTLIGLDIAFVRRDGTVVDIQKMEPLSLVAHAPRESYRYAIEVKAGTLAKAGLQIGHIVSIPADQLNP